MQDPDKLKFSFERKLSIDGVAIIIGVVSALIFIGSLKQKINDLGDASMAHTKQLTDLGTSVQAVRSDVAVLQAVVNERTTKR